MVLLVEDDDDTREFMRMTFEMAGVLVAECREGELPLETIARVRPDIVVLNGRRAGEDGWAVCRRLRTEGDPDVRDTPVIFIGTARGDGETKAFAAGCDLFLLKPFEMSQLVIAANRLLARRRGMSNSLSRPRRPNP